MASREENLLSSLFTQGGQASSAFGTSGKQSLDTATNFFKTLLSGDRSAIEKLIAPAANQIRSQADATKKEQAQKGTARTGGTVAGNQQIEDEVRKQIGTIIQNAQGTAAGNLGQLGEAEIGNMLQALGITTGAVGADVASRRQASASMWSSLIKGGLAVATAPLNAAGDTLLGKVF